MDVSARVSCRGLSIAFGFDFRDSSVASEGMLAAAAAEALGIAGYSGT